MALLLALVTAACDEGTAFDPGTLPNGGSNPATGGGGGGVDTTTAGLGNAELVGRWSNVVVVETENDVQTITTVWRFDSVGTCRRTVETNSVLAGVPIITVRDGTCRASATQLVVRFTDATEDVVFELQFSPFDRNRLLINGVEFQRITVDS